VEAHVQLCNEGCTVHHCTIVVCSRGSARVFPLDDWSSCTVGLTYKLQLQIRSRISKKDSFSLSVYEGRQGRSEP
jgi:hypothetical protein